MPSTIRKKILFISHESSLTGAPVLLINLLKLIKQKELYDFEILLYRGGTLEKDFKELAPTSTLKGCNYATTKNMASRFINYIGYRLKLKKWSKKVKQFDLVFSNTITNGKVLKALSHEGIPVISYVHELQSVINQYWDDAYLTLQLSDVIAVPSSVVGNTLKLEYSVSEKKLSRLDYFFPINRGLLSSITKQEARQKFLNKFQLSKEVFYVVSMGTATYRKGIDLFLEICEELKSDLELFFVWMGDFVEEDTKRNVLSDCGALPDNLLITGFLPHSFTNLLPFDLFCLSSREDPYPLVVVEAAIQKVPTLCFNSGGASEFVSDECGWLVEDFSPKAMAQKIKELKDSKKEIETVGNNAFNKAISLHANEERIIFQFNSIIKQVLT